VESFIRYARDKPHIMKYLPEENGWNHQDKKWICDVLFTIDQQGF
jgi:hypothetical protein